ncbi:MAG TPA: hypothetical protein VEC37_02715 [Bacillota bacterium]|nr:hypothetical protein [Bacillota bacterium]
MSLENLKIWVSPLTNTIFAGYLTPSKKGTHCIARQKVNVTDMAISAVTEHMHKEKFGVISCPAGKLIFVPSDTPDRGKLRKFILDEIGDGD